jgi:hypothetical protein
MLVENQKSPLTSITASGYRYLATFTCVYTHLVHETAIYALPYLALHDSLRTISYFALMNLIVLFFPPRKIRESDLRALHSASIPNTILVCL